MAQDADLIKNELYDFLRAEGMSPVRYDNEENPVQDSSNADFFQIKFIDSDDENYGTLTLYIDGANQLVLLCDDEVKQAKRWLEFIKRLKRFAITHQLGIKMDDMDSLNDFRARTKKQKLGLSEGYYGTKNTSYTDKQPSTIRIVLKHSKPIEEGDQRFRNVEKIFLENEQGERILVPTVRPSIARMYARHLAESGMVNDDRWKHITEIADEVNKLSGFIRATRNAEVINEAMGSLINEAVAYYEELKGTVGSIQTTRGYNRYFESWKPSLLEDDSVDVSDMFRINRIDPRIENALPVLNKLSRRVTGLQEMREVGDFENWADSLINETIHATSHGQEESILELVGPDSEAVIVGPGAMNIIPLLHGVIDDSTLNARLKKIAASNPNVDARDTILSWMQEQGNDPFYSKILDKINTEEKQEPDTDSTPEPNTDSKPEPEAPTPEPQGQEEQPEPEAEPDASAPPLEEDGEEEDDVWDHGDNQEFKSHKTSINISKLPATFGKLDALGVVKPGMVIADIGGGRFDNAVEWAKDKGAKLFVYDPFNRSPEHNKAVVGSVGGGKADIATCNNVLNVIKEPHARERVIKQVANVLKPGGTAFFLIYEGSKSGEGKPTQGNLSWQNNMPTRGYAEEIAKYFGDVKLKNGMLVATKGGSLEEDNYEATQHSSSDHAMSPVPESKKKVVPSSTPRNFVAKNAQSAGAGKHTKQGEYNRKEKHPHRELRKIEATESALSRLKRLSGL